MGRGVQKDKESRRGRKEGADSWVGKAGTLEPGLGMDR